jgi:hypothetical protein
MNLKKNLWEDDFSGNEMYHGIKQYSEKWGRTLHHRAARII